MKNSWFANGKLLLTGEYLVMEGAKALALPLKKGQRLTVRQTETGILEWKANAPEGLWFQTAFKLPSLEVLETSDPHMSEQLGLLLRNAVRLSGDFLMSSKGLSVITELDFDPQFGFGSSSTLVYCVARWANADPFKLQWETFGGSGYDIACADAGGPVTYRLSEGEPEIQRVDFLPSFKDSLYFVYLDKKQQTAESIRDFRENAGYSDLQINRITVLTDGILQAKKLGDFEEMIDRHEQIMSEVLNMPVAKSLYLPGYEGAVKSLGAWGGDFLLVTGRGSREEFIRKMKKSGFNTIYGFSDLVLT